MPAEQPSTAAEQAQARADVERIAKALYVADAATDRPANVMAAPWDLIGERKRERYRFIVRRLLRQGAIHVGRRPEPGAAPLRGQLELPD